jgi:hypothetical protein
MRKFNLSSKIVKKITWMEKIRNDEFNTKEEYSSLHQLDHSKCLRKKSQFAQEWSQQNHKHSAISRREIEHIHIMIPNQQNPILCCNDSMIGIIQNQDRSDYQM